MASSQCQVQVSVNSGAWQSGGIIAVPFGATIAVRNIVPSARSYTWELPDYGPAMAVPANWQSVGGVYTSYVATPANFTLPASGPNAWGKYPIRLRINGNPLEYESDGSLNPAFQSDWTDEATILSVPSPTLQMPGFCFGEAGQFDSLRSWAGSIMANLRAMDAFAAGIGTTTTAWTNLTHATTGQVLIGGQTQVTLNTSGGACLAVMPTTAQIPGDGYRVRFRDPPAGPTYAPPTGCNWGTTPGQVQANAGQYIEDPNAPGTFRNNAYGGVGMPKSNGATQDYTWHALSSAWLLS